MIRLVKSHKVSPTAHCALAAGLSGLFSACARVSLLVPLLVLVLAGSSANAQTPSKPVTPQRPSTSGATASGPAAAKSATPPTPAKPAVDYAQRYAQECAACHGADGRGGPNLAPSLAGQHGFYAITQLFLFKNGRRDSDAMNALAKDFSNDDLRGFSDVIGKLPAQATQPTDAAPDDARIAIGRSLANSHQCLSCHGKDLAGAQQVPRLAGQYEDYLKRVMGEFRSGKRLGYTTAMNEALTGLKPEDLDNLAYFLARHPGVK